MVVRILQKIVGADDISAPYARALFVLQERASGGGGAGDSGDQWGLITALVASPAFPNVNTVAFPDTLPRKADFENDRYAIEVMEHHVKNELVQHTNKDGAHADAPANQPI